jgi:hypothetical protein
MTTRLLAVAILAASLVGACASLSAQPAAALRVRCNVPQAALLLDGVMMGRAAQWAGPDRFVKPGFYRVELRHPGHHSYFSELTLADGASAVIEAELHPLLD